VLPATTQLEQTDIHTAYGHLYFMANNAAIAPLGESLPNSEVFRRMARKMNFADECLYDSDEDLCRQTLALAGPRARGIEWDTLKEKAGSGSTRPSASRPLRKAVSPRPPGNASSTAKRRRTWGWIRCRPTSRRASRRSRTRAGEEISARRHLAAEPHFLNSSSPICLSPSPRRRSLASTSIARRPPPARSRRRPSALFNDRGSLAAKHASATRRAKALVVALSVWWKKLAGDGRNANEVTSQALTDIGRGATFYDCLVEVERIAAV